MTAGKLKILSGISLQRNRYGVAVPGCQSPIVERSFMSSIHPINPVNDRGLVWREGNQCIVTAHIQRREAFRHRHVAAREIRIGDEPVNADLKAETICLGKRENMRLALAVAQRVAVGVQDVMKK